MSTVDLEEYKKIQQSKAIVEDLDKIIRILTLTNRGLRGFYYYEPVRDVLAIIKDAKVFLEIGRNQHLRIIEGKKDEK